MAKLKGPLFSLGASQQLGKALVYFPWKGLNVVREYVIPSNPKTTLQNTQRGYLKTIVGTIHGAMADPVSPMNEADISAYALLGSIRPTPRTWFNEAVKQGLDQQVAGKDYGVYHDGVMSHNPASVTLDVWVTASTNPTPLDGKWGTSKTALINTVVVTEIAADHFNATFGPVAAGTKIYCQLRPTGPAGCIGMNSGIYHDTTA